MANISDANGIFKFDKNFYAKNQNLIDEYFEKAKEYLIGEYGVYVTKNNHDGSFDFEGAGKNSMYSTLPWSLAPVSYQDYLTSHSYDKVVRKKRTIDDYAETDCIPLEVVMGLDEDETVRVVDNPINKEDKDLNGLSDIDKLFLKLIKLLVKENSSITFDYKDFEPGSVFLVSEQVTMKPSTKDQIKPSKIFEEVSSNSEDLGYNDANIIDYGFEDGYDLHKEEDVKSLLSDYLEEWYEKQGDDFIGAYTLKDIINGLKTLSDDDKEYNGKIREYRFEDEDTLYDLVDDALMYI
ncbi:MAG: hypothetical protein HDS11_02860 [Bacteroides sp.]|nr:hypothetical protein [Bacteroides sp.]